jgi:hypothetical protein
MSFSRGLELPEIGRTIKMLCGAWGRNVPNSSLEITVTGIYRKGETAHALMVV